MDFLCNKLFLIALTLGVFAGSQWLYRRLRVVLLNPILVTILVIIGFLSLTGVDYEDYRGAGCYIDFWLKPAVVALGVPLYRQLGVIRKQILPVLVAELAGCVVGVVSVIVTAELFGATRDVVVSLVPKAVTTPIAIEISQAMEGIPPLTAAVVVCTGILGNLAGFMIVRLTRVRSAIAGSLSVGTASHAVGTAAAMERGERWGAYSSLGLTLNGLLTALLTPPILTLLGYI